MVFVTRLRLTGGDRETLDSVVSEIVSAAERKGIETTGPHSRSPTRLVVPQYRRSPPSARPDDESGDPTESATVDTTDDTFDPWQYTVYERELEIVGREEFVREVAARDIPDSVRIEAEVDRRAGAGG